MTAYPHLLAPPFPWPENPAQPCADGIDAYRAGRDRRLGTCGSLLCRPRPRRRGVIVTGGMAPNAEGGVFPGAAGLFTDADIANHARVTAAVHAEGGHIAMQILHAGRYAYSKDCVAPSAIRSPISPFPPANWMRRGSRSRSPTSPPPPRAPFQAAMTGSRSWAPRGIS